MGHIVARPIPRLMTVEEYLALERHCDVKHEYIDGYVYAVAGGTSAQSVSSGNIIALLRPHLRGGPCRVHTSDMRVRLSATRYVYPDVSVSCDERDRVNSEQDEIHYPRLVVEVLSRTTHSSVTRTAPLLWVEGVLERRGRSISIRARRVRPGTDLLHPEAAAH